MSAPLLLFDAIAGGHHDEYVGHLVRAISARGQSRSLALAVPRIMLDAHPEWEEGGARVTALPTLPPPSDPWQDSRRHWTFLDQAVREHRPARVLLLYADAVIPTLAGGARLQGRPELGTIHFRPPVRQSSPRPRERVRDVVKGWQLRRVLRRPDLRLACTLDPRSIPTFREQTRGAHVVALPDPVALPTLTAAQQSDARAEVRRDLGVDPERHLMVLFGALEPRKGIFQTVEAIHRVAPDTAKRLAVAFVGSVQAECREAFYSAVEFASGASAAHVILKDRRLEDREITPLMCAADTILIPYQRHLGSSGVLIRAAGLQQPTIAQQTDLIGAWTREHNLGRTVDSTDPAAIARAVEAAVASREGRLDRVAARAFAAGHTPDAFVRDLLDGPAGMLPGATAAAPAILVPR